MHPQSTGGPTLMAAAVGALTTALHPCGFGLCPRPATRRVETRAPIGRRIEWLCAAHAARRAELELILHDDPIVSPDALQAALEALLTAEQWLAAEVEGSAMPDQHEDVPGVGDTYVHCDIVAVYDQLHTALAPYAANRPVVEALAARAS